MKWLGQTQGSVKFSGKLLPWLSSEGFQCARIRIFFPFHPHHISNFYGQLAGTFPVGISSWVPLLVGFLLTFLTTEPSQCRSLNQPFAASEWCKELVYDGFGLSISLPLKKKKMEEQMFATDKMPMGQVQIVHVSIKPAQDWGGMSRCSLSSVTYSVYSHLFPQGWPGLQVLSLVLKHTGSSKNNNLLGIFLLKKGALGARASPALNPRY